MSWNRTAAYLVAAAVLAAVAFGGGVWMKRHHSPEPREVKNLTPDLTCNLRAGPCSLSLPQGGAVTLSIMPRNLPPMQPLELEVRLNDTGLEALWVDFVGPEMDMGFNRADLAGRGESIYTGSGMVPVCVTKRMLWEAAVMLTDGDHWVRAPFRFEVVR